MPRPFAHPVALANLLVASGLGLAKAHEAVSVLVNDRHVTVTLQPGDLRRLIDEIRSMGLNASAEQRSDRVAAF